MSVSGPGDARARQNDDGSGKRGVRSLFTFVQDAGDDWHRRVQAKRLFQDHLEVVELLQVFEPVSEKKVAAGCAHVSGA